MSSRDEVHEPCLVTVTLKCVCVCVTVEAAGPAQVTVKNAAEAAGGSDADPLLVAWRLELEGLGLADAATLSFHQPATGFFFLPAKAILLGPEARSIWKAERLSPYRCSCQVQACSPAREHTHARAHTNRERARERARARARERERECVR